MADALMQMYDTMTDVEQKELYDFAMFIIKKRQVDARKSKKNKVPYNVFAGGLHYIADDFDETPEGFEEYM